MLAFECYEIASEQKSITVEHTALPISVDCATLPMEETFKMKNFENSYATKFVFLLE